MPYYLCCSGTDLELCTSWSAAKRAGQGRPGSWTKRYETRAAAEAALAAARGRRGGERGAGCAELFVDGSALLGRWSAAAVWFGPDDARNALQELPPPHTAPRAELAALLLALRSGVRGACVRSNSAFVCQAYEQGWPETMAHQDLMREVALRCGAQAVSVRKVAGNDAVDAMLREARGLRIEPDRMHRQQNQPVGGPTPK